MAVTFRILTAIIVLMGICTTSGAPAPAASGARVWEAPLVIPTYELGPPDPNPVLFGGGRRRPVYPYPMLDSLTNHRVEKSYKAVYLENEYLRVTVLPELGGHLYAIFDKTANRDVIYTNHVIKYGLVGIRGAWVSGGIEWNFPDGHTVTTVSPIDYATRTDPDGTVSVTVGDTERVQRMQWAVAIRLRPGRKVVETEVTLHNRRDVPGRYWFWATASAPAANDLRFAYPMREAYPHAFWPIFSFPKENGVDVGTFREVPNALSLFARNSMRDFMGIYYEKSDWGVVHVADHHEVPGKKTWTWGNDDAGNIWVEKLTEKDGQYVEFQAGRYETQMEHEFLAPHRVERFTEYWFPVNHLGGPFDEANQNAALHVARNGAKFTTTVNVNEQVEGANLIVEQDGRRIGATSATVSPGAAFSATFDAPGDKPLTVRLTSKSGKELIRYRTDTPIDGNPDFKPATPPDADPPVANSAEQAYVAGLGADKKSMESAARAAYRRALDRDPGFAPAHIALGLSYYRTGEYDKAATHLTAALRRNPDAGDAHYYLGLVLRAQGKHGAAAGQLFWAVRSGYREAAARHVLGEMALEDGNPTQAADHLSRAVLLDPRNLKARTLFAMAERINGNLDAAQKRIDAVVNEMPIDYLALHEQAEIAKDRGKEPEAAGATKELERLLQREPDAVLELAFDYLAAGRADDARDVLHTGVKLHPNQPMLHYTLGWICGRSGDRQHEAAEYDAGRKADPALVFPHRVEEIAVLRAAMARDPQDGRAAYYLANALASKERLDEATPLWSTAVKLDPSNVVAHRNLAQALSRKGDTKSAVPEYESAIRLSPSEVHLYLELARMLPNERRIRMLEGTPAAVRAHGSVTQALASAYADGGRFADAAALLSKGQLTSGEGETGGLMIYRKAHLGLARQYQKAGQHEKAAAEYLLATEYPRNLGSGRPAMASQAREYVAAARELDAAGKRDEGEKWWRKAATDPLTSPTEPHEPWSENYYYKALALKHIGNNAEATALYTRLANLNKQSGTSDEELPRGMMRFLLSGMGLKELGRTAEARAALEHVIKIDPRNEMAKQALQGP